MLRRQTPQAKLAAAQLVLARDYGFASWRQLKAHVDETGADPDIRDDKYDATVLRWAEFFGREDFIALIRGRK